MHYQTVLSLTNDHIHKYNNSLLHVFVVLAFVSHFRCLIEFPIFLKSCKIKKAGLMKTGDVEPYSLFVQP